MRTMITILILTFAQFSFAKQVCKTKYSDLIVEIEGSQMNGQKIKISNDKGLLADSHLAIFTFGQTYDNRGLTDYQEGVIEAKSGEIIRVTLQHTKSKKKIKTDSGRSKKVLQETFSAIINDLLYICEYI